MYKFTFLFPLYNKCGSVWIYGVEKVVYFQFRQKMRVSNRFVYFFPQGERMAIIELMSQIECK